jgi:hypothetical protein
LLVYHFKQRLASLEEKGDTMFEIINNIVKEISSLKQAFVQRNTMFPAMVPMTHLSTAFTHPNPSMAVNMNTNEYSQLQNVNNNTNDDDDEDGEDDEDEDGDEDEDDEDAVENIDVGNVVPEEHNIKIVKMEINDAEFDSVEEYEPEIEEQEPEPEIEEEADEDQDQEPEIEADEDQELEPEIEEEEADELEDDQDQEPEPELEEHDFDQEPEEPPAIDKESYRKMNLQQLKSMVVSKGLSKDANKLKKNELIALLEK